MPTLARKVCCCCGQLVCAGSRCVDRARRVERLRGTTAQRGYADGWPKVRRAKLADSPVCEIRLCCAGAVATEVDHRVPIAIAPELRLEWSNLQSACKPCNSAKARQNNEPKRGICVGDAVIVSGVMVGVSGMATLISKGLRG